MKFITLLTQVLLFTGAVSLANGQVPTVQSFTTSLGSTPNASMTTPAGTAAGDLLVASITLEKGSDSVITPTSGWTLIRRTDNGTDSGVATFFKIAGASEPASFEFAMTGQKWAAGVVRITGFDPANPIAASSSATGEPGNVTAPSLTTTSNNALILAYYTNKKGTRYTPATGTTEVFDAPNIAGGAPSHMLATFSQLLAGSTGDQVATPGQTDKWSAQQVAISANPIPENYGLLTITTAPTSGVQISYQGLPGLIYSVDYTDELAGAETVWTSLESKTADLLGLVAVEDTSASTARFYRASLVQ